MNKQLLSGFIALITMMFLLTSSVEAKRFGGGFSFGGKKSYSSSYKQKNSQQKSFSQQKATARNQQRKQQFSKRGGLMGMLGGLALGGLLGALFFGGAFENINFFDMFIIGALIWAVMWFMKRKAQAAVTPGGYNIGSSKPPQAPIERQFKLEPNHQHRQPSAANNTSRNDQEASFADSFNMNNKQNSTDSTATNDSIITLPAWFNQEEFLDGARSAYSLLQQAWGKADLDAVRELTTDSVFNEISQQFTHSPSQGETRILQLNAQLIDFNELDDSSEASVLFDALLDEANGSERERAQQVRELWHFIRANNSNKPTWYLDGIQQLD